MQLDFICLLHLTVEKKTFRFGNCLKEIQVIMITGLQKKNAPVLRTKFF